MVSFDRIQPRGHRSPSAKRRDDGDGAPDQGADRAINHGPVRQAIVAMTTQIETLEQAILDGVRELTAELESLRTAVNAIPTMCAGGEAGQFDHDLTKHLCSLVLSKADLMGRRLTLELAGVTDETHRVFEAIANLQRADRSTVALLRQELTEIRSILGAKTGDMHRLLDEIDGVPGYPSSAPAGATLPDEVVGALESLRSDLSGQFREGLRGLRSEIAAIGDDGADGATPREVRRSPNEAVDHYEQGVLRELRSALHDQDEPAPE
jgi:hypothetical protein